MYIVLSDEVPPRSLFHFDPIPLVPSTVVDVVQGNDALAHNMLTVVGPQIHPFAMASPVMQVVARQIEMMRLRTIGAQADITRMMNMASIDPDLTALAKPKAMAHACYLDSP